jgi:hypothetical protein
MPPAVFINLDLEAFGHAGLLPIFRDVAPRAGHAGGSALASLWPVPRPAGMGLANPTAVMAKGASSWALGLILILSRLAGRQNW